MYYRLSVLLGCVAFVVVLGFGTSAYATLDVSYYGNYTNSHMAKCAQWKTDAWILKKIPDNFTYPAIPDLTDTNSQKVSLSKAYEAIEELPGSPSCTSMFASSASGARAVSDYLKAAQCAHREIMNAVYACGVIRSKLQALGQVRNIIKEVKGTEESNTSQMLEDEEKAYKKESEDRSCTTISEESDNGKANKILLDNATYFECQYQGYLTYLTSQADNLAGQAPAPGTLDSSWGIRNSEIAVSQIAGAKRVLADAVVQSPQAYRNAFFAYRELTRTYAYHILLLIILDDYSQIRSNLRSFLNPIGQFIYKSQNAQTPKNTS